MFQQLNLSYDLLSKIDKYQDVFLYHLVRFELEKRCPLDTSRIFSYENGEEAYYFAVKENNYIPPHVSVSGKGSLTPSNFLIGFEKFLDAFGFSSFKNPPLFIAKERFVGLIEDFLKKREYPFEIRTNPCLEFVITKEQEKIVMDLELPKLPEGYEFGTIDPKDTEFIVSKWKFATEGEMENSRQKITSNPSSSIYFEGTLAGFELVDTKGGLSHQYVLEEHRGKGLGRALEMDLAKKCIRDGQTVFKHVEMENRPVVDYSLRSLFWTVRTLESGEYDRMTWISLTPL